MTLEMGNTDVAGMTESRASSLKCAIFATILVSVSLLKTQVSRPLSTKFLELRLKS